MTREQAQKRIVEFINSFDVCSNAVFCDDGKITYVTYDLQTKFGIIHTRIEVFDRVRDNHECFLYTNDDDELFLNHRFEYEWDERSQKKYEKEKVAEQAADKEAEIFWKSLGITWS